MKSEPFNQWLSNLFLVGNLQPKSWNILLLIYRVALGTELFLVHGLKKLGITTGVVEQIPNPFGLPSWLNDGAILTANLVCPIFVILGLFTRFSTIPIWCVTLMGYLVVHAGDSLLVKDTPFMYSLSFIFLTFAGAGNYSLDYFLFSKSHYDE
jgi:putative oxidoreductase